MILHQTWNHTQHTWVTDVTLDQQLNFLLELADVTDERQASRALYPVLLLVLAFATRGQMSARRLQRVTSDLRASMGTLIEMLRLEDIALTWANFGHLVHDGNIGAILHRWMGFLPVSAIRLRVALDQAAGSGLTSLDVIARAVAEFPISRGTWSVACSRRSGWQPWRLCRQWAATSISGTEQIWVLCALHSSSTCRGHVDVC